MDKQNQDLEQEVSENQGGQQNGMENEVIVEQGDLSWGQIWENLKAWVKKHWLKLTIGIIAFAIILSFIPGTSSNTNTYTYTHKDGTKCSFIVDFEDRSYQYSGYKLMAMSSLGYFVDSGTTLEKEGSIFYKETVNGRKKYWSADFDYYLFLSEDETTLYIGGLTFQLE